MKPIRALISKIYFLNKTLHVSDISSVHHQEFFTVHTAIYTGFSKPVWHIPLLYVQSKTPDDGQRNCPKHVEFYYKSGKYVHKNILHCTLQNTINNISVAVQILPFYLQQLTSTRSTSSSLPTFRWYEQHHFWFARFEHIFRLPATASLMCLNSLVCFGGLKEFVQVVGRVQLKCDGTRWRMGGEVKGKLANGVGSQYSSHYLGTWCIQHYYRWCAHLGCQ